MTIYFIVVASSYDLSIGVKRLTFRPGVNTLILRVRIYDDKRVEGTEAFGVQLIVPDFHIKNGLKLGRPSLATVFIKDSMYRFLYNWNFS